MIVLDTNVLSELVRPVPDRAVVGWVDQQDSSELVITALTAAEVRAGVAVLPDGGRKRDIDRRMEVLLTETFAGFVLPFDIDSSVHYAEILKSRTRAGRPISTFDAQIAAICRQHQSALATRNAKDFVGIDVPLVNPWDAAS